MLTNNQETLIEHIFKEIEKGQRLGKLTECEIVGVLEVMKNRYAMQSVEIDEDNARKYRG